MVIGEDAEDASDSETVEAGTPVSVKRDLAPHRLSRPILWLIVGHAVMGLVGFSLAYPDGGGPTLWVAVFVGLMLSQASLLGIWGGLGTNPGWARLTGVVVGVGFLVPLLGVGIHEVDSATFIVVVAATSCVALPLLVVRFFRIAIHLNSSPFAAAGRIQFSIRHLMQLTFVIACLVAIGKAVQPSVPGGTEIVRLLLISVTIGLVGVLPVWFVLATRQPVVYSVGLIAVGACAGYCLGRMLMGEQGIWMTATTAEVLSVIVSLLVVRASGYRLLRLPPRRD